MLLLPCDDLKSAITHKVIFVIRRLHLDQKFM